MNVWGFSFPLEISLRLINFPFNADLAMFRLLFRDFMWSERVWDNCEWGDALSASL